MSVFLGWGLVGSNAAAQDAVVEVAMAADTANTEHCAELHGNDAVASMADAMVAVAEAWNNVSTVFDETDAVILLYWRGSLAQCLGRNDAALGDLETFLGRTEGEDAYHDLRRQARTRLRRLGRASQRNSPAQEVLYASRPVEVELGYGFGITPISMACTDAAIADTSYGYLNNGCQNSGAVVRSRQVGVSPVEIRAGLRIRHAGPVGVLITGSFRPARYVGLGSGPATPGLPRTIPDVYGSSAYLIGFGVGPVLEGLAPMAGASGDLQVAGSLQLGVSTGSYAPMSGYAADRAFVWGGSYRVTTIGPQGRLRLRLPAGRSLLISLEFGGSYQWAPGRSAIQELAPSDFPEELTAAPAAAQRGAGELRLGFLPTPDERSVLIGPFLGFRAQRDWLRFPNNTGTPGDPDDSGDVWVIPGTVEGELEAAYRTYSSEAVELRVLLGIEAWIGLQPGG